MIVIEASRSDITHAMRELHGMEGKVRTATKNAANSTAVTARKMLREYALKRYTIKTKDFNYRAPIRKATVNHLAAYVDVFGKPIPLEKFHVTVNKKRGVKAEILRGNGLTLVRSRETGNKAFHHYRGKLRYMEKAGADGGNPDDLRIYQRLGKPRIPYKRLFGPSVQIMIAMVYRGGQITDEGLKGEIAEIYRRRLDQQIARMTQR